MVQKRNLRKINAEVSKHYRIEQINFIDLGTNLKILNN